jgi:dienelactone hydrolase
MTSKESPVLADPPGECCVQGSVKHFGEPSGETITIAGIQTYISKPPVKGSHQEKVILYLADVFGPFYPNAQLLQDYYASHGFLVLGIDYFFGDPVHLHLDEAGFDFSAWVAKSKQRAKGAFPKWLKEVREIYGTDTKYSAVGYCFGAPFALELAATDDIVAAACGHPASLTEDHFRNITKPLLLSCAETDPYFPKESRRRAEDILEEVKATYHVQIFSGVLHGFATRGDPQVESSRWAKEKSAQGIIQWFLRFSGSGK